MKHTWGNFDIEITKEIINISNSPPTMPGLRSKYKVIDNLAQTINMGSPTDFEEDSVSMKEWVTSLPDEHWV